MRKLILAMVLVMSTLTFAQDRKQGREKLTPEQQTELQVKKMTLDLDLDSKQQAELKTILLEQAKKRESKMAEMKAKKEKGEKPTADERFEMKNEMLDNQIEMKAKMKKILKPEQYKKWEEIHNDKIEKGKERMQKRGKQHRSN
ncbi:hypothetical protein [Flavobacterium lacisediminis]|uniref:LTXXQ motif family protein n=1 Tax=Flavobacterium lacisediminis TaxID=2989705 RepID=A0ABT3EFN6_9FLAO|nr:hypothetical protein [Flavobacterium lacisediminis]MCW1147385.1 hypothetical protein [Flavobacterium lacisediminis]